MFVFLQSVRAAHKPQQLGWGGCPYKRSTAGWVLISKSKIKGRKGINAEMDSSVVVALMLFWTRMIFLAPRWHVLHRFHGSTTFGCLVNCDVWLPTYRIIVKASSFTAGHYWISLTSFLLCCAVSMISDVNTPSSLYVKLNSRSIQYRKNPGVCFH